MANKIVVIHFQPLEFYPPVQNFINTLEKEFELIILSTGCSLNKYKSRYSSIIRLIQLKDGDHKLVRAFKYILFNFLSTIIIIFKKPGKLIYFETPSSFPCYLISKYIYKSIPVFIHYHEYTSKEQYIKGMKTDQYYHSKEMFLYRKADWISHTNEYRLKLFFNDYSFINPEVLKVIPNYPPKNWNKYRSLNNKMDKNQVSIVYLGSISMVNFYTYEICNWVKSKNGQFKLDIYSINYRNDVIEYLQNLNCSYIEFKSGMEYNEIPLTLAKYDVGIIMYKSFSENYTFNATNKLFEYLVCGLDVWYADNMIGISDYNNISSYPKVIPVNFEKLDSFDYKKALNRENLPYMPYDFECEKALIEIKEELKK